jgi:hypothetical protein
MRDLNFGFFWDRTMTDVFAISWVGVLFSQKNEDWLAIPLGKPAGCASNRLFV